MLSTLYSFSYLSLPVTRWGQLQMRKLRLGKVQQVVRSQQEMVRPLGLSDSRAWTQHASLEVRILRKCVMWGPTSMSGSGGEQVKLLRWQEAPWGRALGPCLVCGRREKKWNRSMAIIFPLSHRSSWQPPSSPWRSCLPYKISDPRRCVSGAESQGFLTS